MARFANLLEALNEAPANQPFVTFWVDEDQRETLTFAEFRLRACQQASALRSRVTSGDRVVVIMEQAIPAMAAFVASMMLGVVPAILAGPNFKVDPAKYRSGLAGVTANLGARAVVIDEQFPEELIACVALGRETALVRAGGKDPVAGKELPDLPAIVPTIQPGSLAFIQHSAGTTGLQKG